MPGDAGSAAFLGLNGFRWAALLGAIIAALLLGDAVVGHYRTGFRVKAQYAPFAVGIPLIVASLFATIRPNSAVASLALAAAGWLAAGIGFIGTVVHHVYGVRRQPGGYAWLLHNLMHKAPPLAPLGISAVGALAVLAGAGLSELRGGNSAGLNAPALGRAILLLSAVAIALASMQAMLLHFRGAFHNPLMYAPAIAPLAAAVLAAGAVTMPRHGTQVLAAAGLWLALITGFVGLGMHLRGLDRHMGGLFVGWAVLLEGPPFLAPGVISGFAASGLAALHLLM